MAAVIEEIDRRRIRIGDAWLADFASCNYPEASTSTQRSWIRSWPRVSRWGTHPSWSRLLGNPRIYIVIEDRPDQAPPGRRHPRAADHHPHPQLSDHFVGGPGGTCWSTRGRTRRSTTVVPSPEVTAQPCTDSAPTTSETHGGSAERYPGRGIPAGVHRWREQRLTGNLPDLSAMARVCREPRRVALRRRRARLRGSRRARAGVRRARYGMRGNSLVRHLGETYEQHCAGGWVLQVPSRRCSPSWRCRPG